MELRLATSAVAILPARCATTVWLYPPPPFPHPHPPPYRHPSQLNHGYQRPPAQQGPRPRQNQQRNFGNVQQQQQKEREDMESKMKGTDAEHKEMEGRTEDPAEKHEKEKEIFCYNCGEPDHYSSGCPKPKVCFICQRKDHMVSSCPKWKKPQRNAQYFGSANHGLGFLHVEVGTGENKNRPWDPADNHGVLTIEEGEMG